MSTVNRIAESAEDQQGALRIEPLNMTADAANDSLLATASDEARFNVWA